MKFERVGKHAKLIRGITFKPDDKCSPDAEDAVVCMRTKNVQADLDTSDLIAVPNELIRNREKILLSGDALVSSANSWNLVGKCCSVPDLDYEATAGGFISILRVTSKALDSRYLYHWFSSDIVQNTVRSFANKTTNISNLDHNRTLDLKIPLPSIVEQQRIAGILDQADAIRRKRQQALQLTDDFLRATFLDLFGDPVTNPKGWEVKPLVDEAEVITGYAFPSSEYIEAGEGIPLCRGINVGVGRFNWKDRSDWELPLDPSLTKFQLKTDDIILAMDRPWIKEGLKITKVCEHQEKSLLVQRVARIRATSPARQNLIYFLLNHPVFERHCNPTETTIPHISPVELKEFPVIHPPKELVEQFQKLVQAVDQKVIKLQTGKENDLFASLQQRAFKGEL